MKKTKILAVAIFLVALSVIGYDAYASVQGIVINIDLKKLGGITNYDAAKEYESNQKWSSFGALNSSGKTKTVLVNIKSGSNSTDWVEYEYVAALKPEEKVYSQSWIKKANTAYRAQIRTKGLATSTYSTQNAWYISY